VVLWCSGHLLVWFGLVGSGLALVWSCGKTNQSLPIFLMLPVKWSFYCLGTPCLTSMLLGPAGLGMSCTHPLLVPKPLVICCRHRCSSLAPHTVGTQPMCCACLQTGPPLTDHTPGQVQLPCSLGWNCGCDWWHVPGRALLGQPLNNWATHSRGSKGVVTITRNVVAVHVSYITITMK
jgi:hypothetical protein